ncbi:MAG: sulfurtransferase [Gammaproteobacteria bacterium]|nr:sulfurtransferase [Gammaproteobacteria bacterium]
MDHPVGFLALVQQAKPFVKEVAPNDVWVAMNSDVPPMLVDVRETYERESGYLPGSMGLSKGVLERDIEQRIPDKNSPIIFYCSGGFRSVLAADNAQKMGYAHVTSMAGGSHAWVEQGLPLEH